MAVGVAAGVAAKHPVAPGAPGASLRGAPANPRGAQHPVALGGSPGAAGASAFSSGIPAIVKATANLVLGSEAPRPRRRLDNDCPALPENDQTRAARIAEGVSRIPSNAIVAKTLSAIEYTKQDGTTGTLQSLVDTFINAKNTIENSDAPPDLNYFNSLLNDLRSFIDQNPDAAELTSALSNQLTLNEANFPNKDVRDELITKVVDPFIATIDSFLKELKDLVGEENPTEGDLTSKVKAIASKCSGLNGSLEKKIKTLKDNIGDDVNQAFYSDKYHGAIEGLLSQEATTVDGLKEKIEEWKTLNKCKDKLLDDYEDNVETIRTSMVDEFKDLIPNSINPNDIDKNIDIISQLLEIVSQDNGLFDGTQKTEVTEALKVALEEIASQIGSKVNDLKEKVNGNSESPTIATIKGHASEFSRLNNQVARLSALSDQHLNNDPIGPIDLGTSQSSLSEIKARLIKQLFSSSLIENDGIDGGTIDDIKEIMTNLMASPEDLKTHLDTIANQIPQLNDFIKSIKQCVDDYSVVSAQKANLDDIEKALTRLREIIREQAGSETEALPGLNTLLAELEKQLADIRKCEEPNGPKLEDDGPDTAVIILLVGIALCVCGCVCFAKGPFGAPSLFNQGSNFVEDRARNIIRAARAAADAEPTVIGRV